MGTTPDIEYPEGFIEACDAVYDMIGPIYKAEEILGCWVFETTRPSWISGPMGVVIATGELVHFHIPSLLVPEGASEAHAQMIEEAVGEKADLIVKLLCNDHASYPTYYTPSRYWE